MTKTNLEIYNKVRQVPPEALSQIKGGRQSGKSSINPMWRIKTLTEQFGPVGIGWYIEVIKKEILVGGNEEQSAFVDIHLYVKNGDEWSKPIYGTGGSSFVAKESRGLYTSDECYKMALTDAISVACKHLGIGADVYFETDRDKYHIQKDVEDRAKNSNNRTTKSELTKDNEKTKKSQLLGDILKIAESRKITTEMLTGIIQEEFKKKNSLEMTMQELYALKRRIEA